MPVAPHPHDDAARLRALHALDILDTPSEAVFDDLVQLASQICDTPISLISLIDAERQWFKARVGLAASETPRDQAFCGYAILDDQLLEVEDAQEDARFRDNPLVLGHPHIRFYAGVPLRSPDGYALGTLCVIDHKPRRLSDFQRFALRTLAQQVMSQMALRVSMRTVQAALATAQQEKQRLEQVRTVQDRLLSVMAHDLRNAFYGFEGLLDLLLTEEVPPAEQQELLGLMRNSLRATHSMFNELLAWANSRLDDSAKGEPEPLYPLAAKELDRLRPAADAKGLHLHNRLPPGLMAKVQPDRMAFIVRNLVQNAIKFTATGEVVLRWEAAAQGGGQLLVQDTGRGMSQQECAALFSWDKRHSTAGTDGEPGSGIGLLLCKDFVTDWGGHIEVESKPGAGTAFKIELPTGYWYTPQGVPVS